MPGIKKRYLLDKNRRRVGVVVDLETFKKIEELVEDHLFAKIMEEAAKEKPMSLEEARKYYARLKKRP